VVYDPKTDAAKEVKRLEGDISTAQDQWNTYATILGAAYKKAFEEHRDAIKKVQEKYRLAAESAYWVLSLLCVSHAGGVVGGLMAPWVARAGEKAAKRIGITMTNGISGTFSQGAQMLAQRGVDKSKSPDAEFKPPMKDPVDFWQDLLIEIGLACSTLRRDIEGWMKDLDRESKAPIPHLETARVRQSPLLRDYPLTMPDKAKLEQEAELGLWIAWANVRDVDYWKTRVDTVSTTDSPRRKWGIAIDEIRRLQPVIDRLKYLGAAPLGTKTVEKPMLVGSMSETILDINKLRIAGPLLAVLPGDSVFLGRVADVVKNPRQLLPELLDVPPRWTPPPRKPIAAGPERRVPIASGPERRVPIAAGR